MLSENLANKFNEQLNKELFSEHLYLSMASYMSSMDMDGMDSFFKEQAREEHLHMQLFFNYIQTKGNRVLIGTIDAPESDFSSIEDVFEKTLVHEKLVTKGINELMDIAQKENNHSAVVFLQTLVAEQDEEEETFTRLLNRIRMVKVEIKNSKNPNLVLVITYLRLLPMKMK